ncbi:RND family transporter [Bacteroidota bacterium]
MWAKVVRIILRNRTANLIIIGVITIFMAYMAKDVELTYEYFQLLPKNNNTLIEYQNFKKRFGEDGSVLVIGTDNRELLNYNNFNKWYDLTSNINNIDGVDTVLSMARVYNLKKSSDNSKLVLQSVIQKKPTSQKELDSLLRIIYSLPFYEDLLIVDNDSSFSTLMAITLNTEFVNSKKRIKLIDQICSYGDQFSEDTEIELHYSGMPYIRTKFVEKVSLEIVLFIVLAAIVLAIILYLFFKSFKSVIVSLLVVSISVIWVLGTLTLFNYDITMLTGLIPPLIIVIGIPNCIFLINKYHQEYSKHRNKIKALSRVIQRIGNATLMTNATTALGFATFILTRSKILVEFGTIASINIIGVFFLSLFIIPIIFSYIPPPTPKHTKHLESKITKRAIGELVKYSIDHRKLVYIITIIFTVICFIGISQIKTSGNVVDDIPHKDPLYQDLLFFEKYYKGVLPFEIQIDTKKENGIFLNNAITIYKIRRLEKQLQKDSLFSKYFSRSLSLTDAISFSYQAHKGGNKKYYRVPVPMELNKLKKYTKNFDEKQSNFKSFIDSNKQVTRISIQMANIGTSEIQLVKDSIQPIINRIFPPEEYDITITGTSVVFLRGTNFLTKNLFISLGVAILFISIFMALMFSSGKMVVVYLIPNIIPLLCTGAIMGFTGIAIKPSTILVFSIAFGIAVDFSIHFLAKYRQELKICNYRIRKSVIIALRESGISMIYTAIVLFFGFAIFTASSFGGTKALGILVSITLLVAVISNLTLLPSLLLSLERVITAKAYKEPLIQIYDEEEDIELNNLKIEDECK